MQNSLAVLRFCTRLSCCISYYVLRIPCVYLMVYCVEMHIGAKNPVCVAVYIYYVGTPRWPSHPHPCYTEKRPSIHAKLLKRHTFSTDI